MTKFNARQAQVSPSDVAAVLRDARPGDRARQGTRHARGKAVDSPGLLATGAWPRTGRGVRICETRGRSNVRWTQTPRSAGRSIEHAGGDARKSDFDARRGCIDGDSLAEAREKASQRRQDAEHARQGFACMFTEARRRRRLVVPRNRAMSSRGSCRPSRGARRVPRGARGAGPATPHARGRISSAATPGPTSGGPPLARRATRVAYRQAGVHLLDNPRFTRAQRQTRTHIPPQCAAMGILGTATCSRARAPRRHAHGPRRQSVHTSRRPPPHARHQHGRWTRGRCIPARVARAGRNRTSTGALCVMRCGLGRPSTVVATYAASSSARGPRARPGSPGRRARARAPRVAHAPSTYDASRPRWVQKGAVRHDLSPHPKFVCRV
jgi:hypothetical protein